MLLRFLCLVLLLAPLSARSALVEPSGISVVVPVTDASGAEVRQPGPEGAPLPVVRVAPETPDFVRLRALFASGQPRQVLALHHAARALVRHEVATGRAPALEAEGLEAPVFLLVSAEDGGFARVGLWLEEADGQRRYLPAGYVVLTATAAEVERGDVEEIFAHELAHLTLRVLLGPLPEGLSGRMHMSSAVTDYVTALDEGYAEAFQPLVRAHTQSPGLREVELGMGSADYVALWQSHVDRALRTEGVRRNLFVHEKVLPSRALEARPDAHALLWEAAISPLFAPDTLKSGQQMMASEGVVATLFYRMVLSRELGARYREPDFYRPFLGVAEGPLRPEERVAPEENVHLKLFAALRALGQRPMTSERPLMVELVEGYGRLFPDEREAVTGLFVRTTFGATVSEEAGAVFRQQASAGLRGDLGAFAEHLPRARAFLTRVVKEASEGKVSLGARLGPTLWLEHTGLRVGSAPWATERTQPLRLELNTASVPELMALPGIDLALARRIVAAREARGAFRSVEELRAVPGVSRALLTRLQAMHEAMARAKRAPPR